MLDPKRPLSGHSPSAVVFQPDSFQCQVTKSNKLHLIWSEDHLNNQMCYEAMTLLMLVSFLSIFWHWYLGDGVEQSAVSEELSSLR